MKKFIFKLTVIKILVLTVLISILCSCNRVTSKRSVSEETLHFGLVKIEGCLYDIECINKITTDSIGNEVFKKVENYYYVYDVTPIAGNHNETVQGFSTLDSALYFIISRHNTCIVETFVYY